MKANSIICGDALEALDTIPDQSVHCCVTSPPYWGLRDYGVEGQLGLEKTPEEYVHKLINIFRGVRRVLRADGTLWLNLGDSYAAEGQNSGSTAEDLTDKQRSNAGCRYERRVAPPGLKPKDLVGIPWRVAFALQADGWYLRSDVIWSKPNPMPESVTDRPTKAHEYIFLLSKAQKYFYDCDAVKEPIAESTMGRGPVDFGGAKGRATAESVGPGDPRYRGGPDGTQWGKTFDYTKSCASGRNKRTVWMVTTQPYKDAHFAVFPEELIIPCIKAGTSAEGCCPKCGAPREKIIERNNPSKQANIGPDERYGGMKHMGGNHQTVAGLHRNPGGVYSTAQVRGWRPTCACNIEGSKACIVLDPFMGSGTTALVALKLGRKYLGIELNPDYCKLAEKRLKDKMGLFL